MAAISSLYVELKLMAENFNNGLRDAQREAKEFEKTIKPSLTAAKELGTAMSAAGAAVGGALLTMAKVTADYGDALRDASIRTGETTEHLAGLKLAAEQSGSSFEELQGGLKKFAVNINAAVEGSKKQAQTFKELGVATTDASGHIRPMNDILRDTSEKFKAMPEGIQKSAMAVELFGKTGTQFIEFLSLGGAGMDEFQKKAEKMGLALGADAAAQGDLFNDTLNDLKNATLGLSVVVGTALLPDLISLTQTVVDGVIAFKDFVANHQILIDVAVKLAGVFSLGGALFLGLTGLLAMLPSLTAAWVFLDEAMTANPIGAVVVAIAALVAGLVLFRNEIAGGLAKAYGFMLNGLADIVDAAYRAAIALGVTGLADSLSTAGNAIRDTAANLKDMGGVLLANEPVVNNNSAAVDRFKQAHAAVPPVVKASAEELSKQKAELEKVTEKYNESRNAIDSHNAILLVNKTNMENATRAAQGLRDAVNQHAIAAADDAAIIAATHFPDFTQQVYNAEQAQRDFNSVMRVAPPIFVEIGEDALTAARKQDEQTAATKKQAEALKQATEDVKQSAGKIFDDMFIKGESVFSSLQNALKGGALSIGRSLFEDVVGFLGGPIKKGFDDFFIGLLDSTGIKGFLEGFGKKLGDTLSGVFKKSADELVGGATDVAGGAGGAASSAAGSVASSLASTITAISGVVTAISSVIGNFQMARLEGTMNAVEANTRFAYIEIKDMMNVHLSQMIFYLEKLSQSSTWINMAIDISNGILSAISGGIGNYVASRNTEQAPAAAVLPPVYAAPTVAQLADTGSSIITTNNGYASGIDPMTGRPIQSFDTGGYVDRDQIAMVHQGETVIPASQNTGSSDRIAQLLEYILSRLDTMASREGTIEMDGEMVARLLSGHLYNLSRNDRIRLTGAR